MSLRVVVYLTVLPLFVCHISIVIVQLDPMTVVEFANKWRIKNEECNGTLQTQDM